MTDLTTADVKRAMREVLTDRDVIEPIIGPIVRAVVLDLMKDKFEKTLGIDCTDSKAREECRKNMEFLLATRKYFDTDEGQSNVSTFKRLMFVIDNTATAVSKILIYALLAGAVYLIALGLSKPDLLTKLLSKD